MRPFWRILPSATCGLAILLIGGRRIRLGKRRRPPSRRRKSSNAYAKPPNGGMPPPSSNSVSCTPKAKECRGTTPGAPGGGATPLSRGIPWLSTFQVMYTSKARGVPKDYTEVARWYRKVAEQGYAPAQRTLGLMYADGQGVPLDHGEAHMWFNLAASSAQGDPLAEKFRNMVARGRSPSRSPRRSAGRGSRGGQAPSGRVAPAAGAENAVGYPKKYPM
jgi:hypothetical protein